MRSACTRRYRLNVQARFQGRQQWCNRAGRALLHGRPSVSASLRSRRVSVPRPPECQCLFKDISATNALREPVRAQMLLERQYTEKKKRHLHRRQATEHASLGKNEKKSQQIAHSDPKKKVICHVYVYGTRGMHRILDWRIFFGLENFFS